MAEAKDRSLHEQLVAARARIIKQLDELYFRVTAVNNVADREGGGPPDYRSVYAELQEQLRQINWLLGTSEEDYS